MKDWYKSKTLIVNTLSLVVAVVTAAAGTTLVQDHPQVAAGLTAVLAAVNVALRFLTVTGLK